MVLTYLTLVFNGFSFTRFNNTLKFSIINIKKDEAANADTHTRTSTHPYEHTHVHPIPINTSERLRQFDLEIHEIDHEEHLTIDSDVVYH
jgi:hypothetical protein